MTEASLHRQVAKFLNAALMPEVFWFHTPNGGARTVVAGGNLKAMGMRAGVPDICLIHAGRSYFLELKTRSGSLSKSQKAVIPLIERAGCPEVPVCRSLEDVQEAVLKWGIPLRGAIQ